jgi:hypothetical protein
VHDILYERTVDRRPVLSVAEYQRGIADDIDDARNSTAQPVNEFCGVGRKAHRIADRGVLEPAVDVGGGLPCFAMDVVRIQGREIRIEGERTLTEVVEELVHL